MKIKPEARSSQAERFILGEIRKTLYRKTQCTAPGNPPPLRWLLDGGKDSNFHGKLPITWSGFDGNKRAFD